MNQVSKTRFLFDKLIGLKNGYFLVKYRCICGTGFVQCLNVQRKMELTREKTGISYVGYIQKRFAKRQPTDSDDEETDRRKSSEDIEVVKDYKDYKIEVPNPRVDSILRKVTGYSRTKVEAAFYEGRIYVNDQKLTKKSIEVVDDDVIDLVIGFNKENRELLDVIRIVAIDVAELPNDNDKFEIKVRRFKNLMIDNYEIPWNGN